MTALPGGRRAQRPRLLDAGRRGRPGGRADRRATPKPPSRHRLVGKRADRLDLPAKLFGAAYLHDLAARHAARPRAAPARFSGQARRPRRGRHPARGGGAAVEILREANFVASILESEAAATALGAAEQTPLGGVATSRSGALRDRVAEGAAGAELPVARAAARAIEPPPPTAGYSRPYIAHGSMGPSCGLAVFEDGQLTVWTHAQGVYPLRMLLARVLRPRAGEHQGDPHQGAGTMATTAPTTRRSTRR